jgi:hypothetical protein
MNGDRPPLPISFYAVDRDSFTISIHGIAQSISYFTSQLLNVQCHNTEEPLTAFPFLLTVPQMFATKHPATATSDSYVFVPRAQV